MTATRTTAPTDPAWHRWALDPDSGRYRISKIFPGDNTLPEYRSPLRQPGLAAKPGDYVLAINGKELQAPLVPDELLQGLAFSEPVELAVADAPTEPPHRVKPIASEVNLRELGGSNAIARRWSGCRTAEWAMSTWPTWASTGWLSSRASSIRKWASRHW